MKISSFWVIYCVMVFMFLFLSHIVTPLDSTPISEWYMARFALKNERQNRHVLQWNWTMCSKYNRLRLLGVSTSHHNKRSSLLCQLSPSLKIIDQRHLCSYNAIGIKTHFVLECPLYKFNRGIFKHVVFGSPKSFFQSDQQVDTNLYPIKTTTLCHSRKVAKLKPSWSTSVPLAFWLPKL